MDPYLFLSVLGLVILVVNGQVSQSQMGQMVQRRNFPRRHMGGVAGGGGGGGGGGGMDASMGGTTAQKPGMQGQTQGMPAQGMTNNQNNRGTGSAGMQMGSRMGNGGFGGMGGGIDMAPLMGGGGHWMRMSMAMNSEFPPGMAMGGNFHKNFGQYRACEKTPSNLNYPCDINNPHACPTSGFIKARFGMFGMGGMIGGGSNGMGGMFGGGGNGMGGMRHGGNNKQMNLFICSTMNEYGMARCCAKTEPTARMLDKMFK